MSIPYEQNGRVAQKRRTREALVAAAREMVAGGTAPTVEAAAEAASVSCYCLSVLSEPARPAGGRSPRSGRNLPAARRRPPGCGNPSRSRHRRVHSLEPRERGATADDAAPVTRSLPGRTGRAAAAAGARDQVDRGSVGTLRADLSEADVQRLTLAIRSATGIEALVWLTDVAGLSRTEATELMRWSARALLQSALADPKAGDRTPPAVRPAARRRRS